MKRHDRRHIHFHDENQIHNLPHRLPHHNLRNLTRKVPLKKFEMQPSHGTFLEERWKIKFKKLERLLLGSQT